MDNDEQNHESIHKYVCANEATDPDIKSLGEEWSRLCDDLKINLGYVRSKMDDWFMEVHRSRHNLSEEIVDATGKCKTRRDELYWKFLADFDALTQNSPLLENLQMRQAYDRIKNVQKQEAILQVTRDIQHAEHIQLSINEDLRSMKSKVSTMQDLHEKKDEKTEHYKARQAIQSRQHGSIPQIQHFKIQLDQIKYDIETTKNELQLLHKQISEQIRNLHDVLYALVTNLKIKVKDWQREFQLNYAELEASPNLDDLAPWCSKTGMIIDDVLHGSLVKWQNVLNNAPNSTFQTPNENCCESYITSFEDMLADFLRSTFVVTEQGNFFIKTGNKRFPKFSVRILAADFFSKHSEETTARFISEDDLSLCLDGYNLNWKLIEKYERKLKSNKIKFSAENGKDKMECCFPNLQFAQGFKRANKEVNKQVHEEKYRVLFVTKIASVPCWTLSLPLVVTTASNQEAHSLASIMWQCYSSSDIFSQVNDVPEVLPWSEVAEMLQKKMARLSKKHGLCQENITHLKNRLFGKENMPDNEPVSLTQFCWAFMEDTDFSFWKWFLGVYNLIEQYLQDYWNDGLIMGFVNKDRAEQMLNRPDVSPGTFILRFSDKHFTNSDGRKSVYGRLTSCVVVLKESKGIKRNSSSHHQDGKRHVVEHVDVADFKKLGGELKKQDTEEGAKNSLANILKETWIKDRDGQSQVQMYRFLYPSKKPREELFDKYCEEGTAVSGYKHTREAYIAILEQAMSKIKISKKDELPTQPFLDRKIKIENSGSKKPKLTKDNETKRRRSSRQSSCQSNISSSYESPFHEQSPHCHSQSPAPPPQMSPLYPTQSPYPLSSPAQSVPSPAYNIQVKTNPEDCDVCVPGTDEDNKSCLLPMFHHLTTPSALEEVGDLSYTRAEHGTNEAFDLLEYDLADESSYNNEIIILTNHISPQKELFMNTASTENGNAEYESVPRVCNQEDQTEHVNRCNVLRNTESAVELRVIRTDNGKFSLSPENVHEQLNDTHQSSNGSLDISHLAPDQRRQVELLVEDLRRKNEMLTENIPVTSAHTIICDIPISTSSGSSGELNYSAMQLAAMGSGDIDPNFANSIVQQDNI